MNNEIGDKKVESKQSDLYAKYRTIRKAALDEVCLPFILFNVVLIHDFSCIFLIFS